MKAFYSRELSIWPSMCDAEAKLGVPNTFGLFMDVATEHADILKVGMNDLFPRGLFWLTVRSKAKFYRRPGLMETVTAETWPETPERSRCNRDYVIRSGDEILIEGKTEWMISNLKTGRLYPCDSVFPEDMEIEERRVLTDPYMRMEESFEDGTSIGDYTVRSTDIDLGGHMNNAAYIRAVAGCFSSAEWKDMDIKTFEAAFRAPCFEGERLNVHRRNTPDATEIKLSRDDKTIFLARIGR